MIKHISIAIIVKNGAQTIAKTLDSLIEFSDVVVYDNGSTDNTQAIVKNYINVKLVEGDFLGFGATKNKSASFTKNDWVLTIDADEVIDNTLLKTLKNKTLDNQTIYLVGRVSFYQGKQIKYCGWGSEKIMRLYNKTITHYNDSLIHEKIINTNMTLQILEGSLVHYSFLSVSDFIQKTDKYSQAFAEQYQHQKTSSPFKAVYRALFHFFKCYILQGGFLDGYRGLLICTSGANGVFFKYLKLYELNRQ